LRTPISVSDIQGLSEKKGSGKREWTAWLNWLNYLTLVWVVFLINIVIIILILRGFFGHGASEVSVHHYHHHQYRQKRQHRATTVQRGKVENRRLPKNVQSLCRHYAGSFPSIWVDGWSQMINFRKLRDTHHDGLGKLRLLQFVAGYIIGNRELQHHRYHHYHYHHYPYSYHHRHRLESVETTTEKLSNHLKSITQEHQIPITHLPNILQRSTMSSEHTGSTESHSPPVTPIAIHSVIGVMPRPGQPGALKFDGRKVTQFLKDWDLECTEYGYNEEQKCKKLPRYCSKEIGEDIERLDGCEKGDWKQLQTQMKKWFWQADSPKNTLTDVENLIRDAKAGKVKVDMFVLRYTTITSALMKKHAMSNFQRNLRLVEGLAEDVQTRVFETCSDKGWRILENDVETIEPTFDEFSQVVLDKAKALEKRRLFGTGRTSGFGNVDSMEDSATPTTTATASTVPTSLSSPVPATSDPIGELTKQISKLVLSLEGHPQPGSLPVENTSRAASRPKWEPRCIYCDSLEHTQKRLCSERQEAEDKGWISQNDSGRICWKETGEELPTMFGKGGMKVIVQARLATRTPSVSKVNPNVTNTRMASVGAITFEDGGEYGKLGSSMQMAMVQASEDQWVEVDVEEKRKHGGTNQNRRVKPRLDGSQATDRSQTVQDSPQPTRSVPNFGYPPPVQVTEVPDEDMPDRIPDGPASQVPTTVSKPKFRLASELNQTITTEDVGKKIMEAPIQLRMCELLAVSPEVANLIHDQTRRRRIPVDLNANATQPQSADDVPIGVTEASVNAVQTPGISKPLYACPSARTKVFLNDEVQAEGLLDDGSELNLMDRKVFETLQHPIDVDIDWKIHGYDSDVAKAEKEIAELEKKGNLIGVCHNVAVDVGGVVVKQHLFVVRQLASAEVILGRPWERAVRAQKTNMDDGSFHIKIKSPDGRRIVEFIAVPSQHERIREFVRAIEGEKGKEQGVRH
jgi:hypothetical protein